MITAKIAHIESMKGPAYSQEEPGYAPRIFQVYTDNNRQMFVRGAVYCTATPDVQRVGGAEWNETFQVGDTIEFEETRIYSNRKP